ncbi:probable methyltransferase-like protein 25 [Hylaeus anthracinus]|uniref:probable methyltransferase-like protein 25 n=1 Tax=Hylaeus volcanicus TaxID=313075 RepID=UPI0023B83FF4|nr:probable methyltransferase-like protein 25 [Hylaeus volcanicus]XP_054013640.1 probable methyltransferase-like protein 25 [Hylaeus anthracinus]
MYNKHFDDVLSFINTYNKLINCHVVDFITDNLWETCLPVALRSELERNDIDCTYWTENDNYPILNNFVKLTKSLSLQSCSVEITSEDLTDVLPNITNNVEYRCKNTKTEFMNAKKFHEVESLGNIVGTVAASTGSLVIDAGAGKAYLSTFLAEDYKVPVLAIDSSQSCCKGAIYRRIKLKKKTDSQNLVQYVVEEINEKTDYLKMVKQNFGNWNLDKNLILTGLHTCGFLTHSVIETFLTTEDIHFLCIVPCCYHLTTETFNKRIHFSKNARMLAQQSIERSTENKFISSSLFYRAILQVILHSIGIYNARVGRKGPLHDFPSYAQWAFSRIGVESGKIPSLEELENTYQFYAHLTKRFCTFQMLRVHVGLVLEAAIMLDRILFLQKSNRCSKLAILRLFDPVLSPRHYGIIAIK